MNTNIIELVDEEGKQVESKQVSEETIKRIKTISWNGRQFKLNYRYWQGGVGHHVFRIANHFSDASFDSL